MSRESKIEKGEIKEYQEKWVRKSNRGRRNGRRKEQMLQGNVVSKWRYEFSAKEVENIDCQQQSKYTDHD